MMLSKIKTWFVDEEAATTVEYAILLTLIVLALVQSLILVGQGSRDVFDATANALD